MIHGRAFRNGDGAPNTPGLIMVNETFANKYWPNQGPTGKRMVFGNPGPNNPWITIVGVFGDMRRRGLHQGARLETFSPMAQRTGRNNATAGHY